MLFNSRRKKKSFIKYYSTFTFTASLSAFPTVNFGLLDAGIWIDSPVLGFRPVVAFLWLTLKFPNPTMLTFSSLFRELVIESKRLSIALVESDLDKPAEDATEAIKSFLLTFDSFYYNK